MNTNKNEAADADRILQERGVLGWDDLIITN